jgi:large subunit ribosomal protein L21
MFAVVEIAGIQFEVEQNKVVKVPLLKGNPGDVVEFTNILLSSADGTQTIGTPYIEGTVAAKILEHGQGEKVLVFHKKRRKGHRKLNGHRQDFTNIEVTEITLGKAKKTRGRKKAEVVEETTEVQVENNE